MPSNRVSMGLFITVASVKFIKSSPNWGTWGEPWRRELGAGSASVSIPCRSRVKL